MLLRLLPIPTPSSPAPPTILFTLPLPTHPYTSRGLPLPPNLLAHRSVCLQEDLDCANVLLGEKSSWISGIVDDVTFSLPLNNVTILLIDGTILTVPLSAECVRQLRLVIHEVQLSFAPPEPAPRTSISSAASTSSVCSNSSARRSTSSLLYSILSPLLTVGSSATSPTSASFQLPPPQPPARVHRRQARSLLVDTYRCHVLPLLREKLPSAYLPWIIASESAKRTEDFERLRNEIDDLLSASGVDRISATPMKRTRSVSDSSVTDSDSDDDETMSPVTPATSIFSPSGRSTPLRCRGPPSPQSYLSSLPPSHSVPAIQRSTYSSHLARLSKVVHRLNCLSKLRGRYDREEGKRRWLEGLERGRQGDKALRRAFSIGELKATSTVNAKPVKRSHLWRSWTAEDQERSASNDSVHPALLSPACDSMSDSEEEYFTEVVHSVPSVSTSAPPRRRSAGSAGTLNLPNLPDLSLEDSTEEVTDTLIVVQHGSTARPPITHRDATAEVPALQPSRSDESLPESEEWDEDVSEPSQRALPAQNSCIGKTHLPSTAKFGQWGNKLVSMSKPVSDGMSWESSMLPESDELDGRVEVYNGVTVRYA